MAVWPKETPFDATTPSYGANRLLYLGCVPRTADTTWKPGQVHRGYGNSSSPACTVAGEASSGDFTNSPGFLLSRLFVDDVKVELASRKFVVGTPLHSFLDPGHAVGARIQGGTLADDGTAFVRYEDVSGYVLRLENQGLDWRLKLLRFVSGGVATVAQTAAFSPPAPGSFFTDFTLSLELTNNAGDVDFVGKVSGLSPSEASQADMGPIVVGGGLVHYVPAQVHPPGPQSSNEITLTGTDTNAARITTAGRAGFFMDRERVESNGALSISRASLFRVTSDPLGTPVVEWEDEFRRAALNLGANVTDLFGTVGDSLQSEFHGDNFGADQANILKRNAAGYVTVAETEDMGSCVSLAGAATPGPRLELQDPLVTWPAPVAASSAEWTVLVWAKPTDNRDGNGLWDQYDATADNGFAFGLVTAPDIGGKMAAKFEVSLGDGATAQVYESSAFVVEDVHLDKSWAYAVSYKANSNASNGEGRLRYYVGRLGQVKMISESAVPSSVRPTWPDGFGTIVGERRDKTGVPADRAFEGQIDELVVSFSELPASDLDVIVDQFYLPQAQWLQVPINVYAAWTLDTWTGSPERTYRTLGGGVNTGEFRVFSGAASLTPGLVPVRPVDRIKCHHQRGPESFVEQRCSVRMKIPDGSRGRAFVRGGVLGQDHYSAYALDVSPGEPAFVQLVRVVAVQVVGVPSTVERVLARQNLSTGAIDVAATGYTKLDIEATQDGGSPTGNVTIKAYVDTVKPTWELVSSDALLDASGHVIDKGSTRVLFGTTLGFDCAVIGSTDMEVDDFNVETPSSLVTDPDSYPAYTLPGQADAKSGSLLPSIIIGWNVQRTREPARSRTRTYTPIQQRMLLDSFAPRYYSLTFTGAYSTEVATLLTFLDDHRGPEIPFDFDPSPYIAGDYAGVFHFLEDRVRVGYAQAGGRVYSLTLEEIPTA